MSLFRRDRRTDAVGPLPVLPPSSAFLAPPPPFPPPSSEPVDLSTREQFSGGGVPVLQLDQGSVLRLDRSWVVGRDPVAPPAQPDAVPFGIADATKSVSKTHLAIGPAAAGAWVIDLHSTNGVSVQQPGSAPRALRPGETVTVPVGTTITYGERSIVIQG
ncbi:FHA domain-containing protein [Nocardioides sp. MH1]|uniref:FHA domain-containing protein n=1 Tax=Nocardioides sp. MH1 TaxID=3242490 RepID=UPI003521789C